MQSDLPGPSDASILVPVKRSSLYAAIAGALVAISAPGHAQERVPARADADPSTHLAQDLGTVGLHQALTRLRTTASLMHTTAHPDDEQAAVLTWLARGQGVRTSLLTLNRGEGGANAIGPELFDALGVIRTEELLLAGRHYGIAAQYFTTAVDYGFSKTLEEAMESWGREAILEDMVRILRRERPLVVVSRFHGSERDGHGHHQAAGVLTPEAVAAASDPTRFPEQLTREGLQPWSVKRLFRGGVRAEEEANLTVVADEYAPFLGTTFDRFAAYGLSLQRSQTAGRIRRRTAPVRYRYEQLSGPPLPPGPGSFFDGLPTSLPELFELTAEDAEPRARSALIDAAGHVDRAMQAVRPGDGGGATPHLLEALAALRRARDAASRAPEARRILTEKIGEAEIAARLATGGTLQATAVRIGPAGEQPAYRVAPGDSLRVRVELGSGEPAVLQSALLTLDAPGTWAVAPEGGEDRDTGNAVHATFLVRVPPEATSRERLFMRDSFRENRYRVTDSSAIHLPWGAAPITARATVSLPSPTLPGGPGGQLTLRTVVRGEEEALPRGILRRSLRVVPPVSVRTEPPLRIVPENVPAAPLTFTVHVTQSTGAPTEGHVTWELPEGWEAAPPSVPFASSREGETRRLDFALTPPDGFEGEAALTPVAHVGGRAFRESEDIIRHPDLEVRSLPAPSSARVVGFDVTTAPNRQVGYVMGVGDQIPEAIRALGAQVTLLDEAAVATAELGRFHAVVLGTRAYAVRPELVAQNGRLLRYVEGGGHLIVLYQTQEYDPEQLAPHRAVLPRGAEEVSEERAPVRLLSPDHVLLTAPNRIGPVDFDGWVEQRGSKFFSEWDEAFTALVETHDRGQEPQRGVWLTAPHGQGHYTYIALALHRQTPYGVAGAYRILANLLAFGSD